ncbi:amino acid adenylation domain-containing protein [Nonomuraea sp. NPDC050643]|uniref:non-ribosomal peptide synthetase n=1 Tax=Nonomuraea sp. NPDC050643 TaxID=3155660 RepID=UPI0033D0DE92
MNTTKRAGEHRLSRQQLAMWLREQLLPGTAMHHVAAAYEIEGPLDVPALTEALRALAIRHEAFRTAFQDRAGTPVARVLDDVAVELPIAEADDWRSLVRAEASRPFDLTAAPLLRCLLIRRSPRLTLLVVVAHHLVCDAWSLGVLWEELGAAYAAHIRGLPWQPTPLSLTYGQYAEGQFGEEARRESERHRGFWRRRLAGAPATSLIPADRPRPAVGTQRGAIATRTLAPGLLAAAQDLAVRRRASLFMVLTAAWTATLSRYAGQDEVVIGIATSGRDSSAAESVIGPFADTYPLRIVVDRTEPFTTLAQKVRHELLGCLEHQEVSLADLVADLQDRRDLSMTPIFQVLFNLVRTRQRPLELDGAQCRYLSGFVETVQTDLALTVTAPDASGIQVRLLYSTDLYDKGTADNLLSHYENVLAGALAEPEAPLGARHMTPGTASSRRQVAPVTALDLIDRELARRSEAAAVHDGADTVTYGELSARAAACADHLKAAGVGHGDVVAVPFDSGLDMITAILGIWRIGAVYLPLNPDEPTARLTSLVTGAAAAAVMCAPPHLAAPTPAAPRGSRPRTPEPDDLAYLMYTSGSSGEPKGVDVPHRAIAHLLQAMAERPGLDARDAVLALTRPTFDISLAELLLPLTVGARVVVAPPALRHEPEAVGELVREHGVSTVQATPTGWRQLLLADVEAWRLRRAWCGGEALDARLADRLASVAAEAWNLYGPTETTVWSLARRLEPGMDVVPIGSPLGATSLMVLDGWDEPAPPGVPGELCIGMPGVAEGYRGRPDLTADRFVPDPHGAPGTVLYRTGDLVRRRPDGDLQFLGRLDRQVKLNGHRIEPAEIEAVLRRHSRVRDAVVMLREDTPGDPRLVAYVTRRDPGERR